MAGNPMSDDSMDMEGEGLSPVKSLGMCLRIESAAGCEATGVLSPLVAPGVSPASMKAELRAARLQLSAHGLMHRYVRSDVPPQPEALTACLLARLLQREVGSRANHRAWRYRRGSDAGGPLRAFPLPSTASPRRLQVCVVLNHPLCDTGSGAAPARSRGHAGRGGRAGARQDLLRRARVPARCASALHLCQQARRVPAGVCAIPVGRETA